MPAFDTLDILMWNYLSNGHINSGSQIWQSKINYVLVDVFPLKTIIYIYIFKYIFIYIYICTTADFELHRLITGG